MTNFTLTHIRLLVDNFPDCFRFYRDLLALQPQAGDESGPYVEFRCGTTLLALFDRSLMSTAIGSPDPELKRPETEAVVLCFSVPDVDSAYMELEDAGAEFISPPTNRNEWMIRTAHFRDPDGNLIEISAPLRNR